MSSDQYLHLLIAKNDLRTSAAIYSPSGKKMGEFTSDRFGPFTVAFVAEEAGSYRLEIRSKEQSSSSLYELTVQAWRDATQTDRRYASALQKYAAAEHARAGWEVTLLNEAINQYSSAATGWTAIKKHSEAGTALSDAGDMFFVLSKYNEALSSYQKALESFTLAGDALGRMNTQNNIGYTLLYLGGNADAAKQIQGVLDYCNSTRAENFCGNKRLQAQAFNNMGEVFYALSDLPKALDYFQKALELWIAVPDRRGQALAELNMGYSYYDLGDIDEASKHYKQGLRLAEDVDDRRGQALSRTALGGVHSFLGEKQLALEFHSKAMDLFRAIGDREGEAASLNGLGKAYEDLNDHETALAKYSRALQLYTEVGNRNFEALGNYYVGRSYRLIQNFRQAVRYYNRCVALSRELGTRRFEAYALKDLGIVYDLLGEREKALERFNHALSIYKDIRDRRGQAYAFNSIGYVYYQMRKLPNAIEYFTQALSLSQSARDRQAEISILYNLARAKRDLGNISEALSRTQDSINIIESLRAKIVSRDLRASYFASLHQHYELYIDVLMMMWKRTGHSTFVEAALQASEQSRARSLLEVINEVKSPGRQYLEPALLDRKLRLEKSLNAKAEYQMRLLNGNYTEERAAALSKEIHDLTVEYDSVQSEIKSQSPSYALLTQPQLLELDDIQSEVEDENTLLLEYFVGEQRSYLWAVSRSGLSGYELPARTTIEDASRKFYDLLTSRQPRANESNSEYQRRVAQSDADFCRVSQSLGQMLLGPVANQLGRKKLLISHDGALHYVPFEALSVSAKCRQPGSDSAADDFVPLIVDHEIVKLPSVSVLAALRRQRPQQTDKTVVIFADPVFEINDPRLQTNSFSPVLSTTVDEGPDHARHGSSNAGSDFRISRLPSTLREGHAILATTSPGEGVMITGVEADRALATSSEMARYRIVHFATHAMIDSENPPLSGLVLSRVDKNGIPQNGFLRLADIYNLNLNADLVVLSACRTSLGKDVTGEGLVGLTQGFMYAGAKGIVGSLWKVDDEATAVLMEGFYSSMLKDGLTPSAALQAAKLRMWRHKRWRSPYYWSGFVLQGEYERVSTTTGYRRRLTYPALAAVLILVSLALGYYVLRLARRRRNREEFDAH